MCALGLAACGGGSGGFGTSAFSGPVLAQMLPAQASTLGVATFATPSRGTQSGFALSNGFAVYAFGLDDTASEAPACTGSCASSWPPVLLPAGATAVAPFGSVRRRDGSLQLAYNGHPLYTSALDTAAGTAKGDGVEEFGSAWRLAQTGNLQPLGG
jgi:predicted lipoprotein with Yx(FWY)xxD motif